MNEARPDPTSPTAELPAAALPDRNGLPHDRANPPLLFARATEPLLGRVRNVGSRLSTIRPSWLWALIVTLLAVGGFVYAQSVRGLPAPGGPAHLPWWTLIAAFTLAESYVVRVRLLRAAAVFSLGTIPLVGGMFFIEPGLLVPTQLAGFAIARLLHARRSGTQTLFALSNTLVGTCVALSVFHRLAALDPALTARDWLAALAATGASLAIQEATLVVASRAGRRHSLARPTARGSLLALGVTAANTFLALVAVTVAWNRPEGLWLLSIPVVAFWLSYRSYTAHRGRVRDLEFLYASLRTMQHAEDLHSAIHAVLGHARAAFGAELAELVIVPGATMPAGLRLVSSGTDEPRITTPPAGLMEDALWDRILGGETILLPASGEHRELDTRFEAPIRDALIAPLRGEDRLFGTILLANRVEGATFTDGDSGLFERFSAQVAESLERVWLERSTVQVSELKEQLRRQALHDSLTSLANRTLFGERLQQALSDGRKTTKAAVLFVDLDDFKAINDGLGHAAGDALLVAFAERLRACLRPSDTAARLGGDEFAVLLEDMQTSDVAIGVAKRILEALQSPFIVQGKGAFVRASIGIAIGSPGRSEVDELMRNADVAMYAAKSHGKNRYELFHADMYLSVLQRLQIGADLQSAIEHREFAVEYQPIFDLLTGRLYAVETLVRWQHPVKGVVSPAEFIELAEEYGLVLPLGRWVLTEACRQAGEWQTRYPSDPPLTIAVNLSARELQDPEVAGDLVEIMQGSGIAPNSLILELTERALVDGDEIIERLRELRGIGIRLAIDDFGTGYSSLMYLKKYPVDLLKIDRQFVRDVGSAMSEEGLTRAIIQVARTLSLETIAEGIETTEQLNRLRRLGCRLGQGHLLGRPTDAAGIEQLLTNAVDAAREAPQPVLSLDTTAQRQAEAPA